jgi:hypothetical protein
VDSSKLKRAVYSSLAGFAVFEVLRLYVLAFVATLQAQLMLSAPHVVSKEVVVSPWVVAAIRATGLHAWVVALAFPLLLLAVGKVVLFVYARQAGTRNLIFRRSTLAYIGLLAVFPAMVGAWVSSAGLFALAMSNAKDALAYIWPLGWLVSAGVFTGFSRGAIETQLRKAVDRSGTGRKDAD